MPSPRRFDLIAFDWDGTLYDSTKVIVRCIQRAVVDVGGAMPTDRAAAFVTTRAFELAGEVLAGNRARLRASPSHVERVTEEVPPAIADRIEVVGTAWLVHGDDLDVGG